VKTRKAVSIGPVLSGSHKAHVAFSSIPCQQLKDKNHSDMRHVCGQRNWEVTDRERGERAWLILIAAGFDGRDFCQESPGP
jgi:hypothetical protein